MKRSDFKFVPMWAFEENYISKQKNLPPELRDNPHAKLDFQGKYIGGSGGQIRAEDVAIAYELYYSFVYPIQGVYDSHGKRSLGWDPYISYYTGVEIVKGYRPGFAPLEYKADKNKSFPAEKQYTIQRRTSTETVTAAEDYKYSGHTRVLATGENAPWFNAYYVKNNGVDWYIYGMPSPNGPFEKPDVQESDLVTPMYAEKLLSEKTGRRHTTYHTEDYRIGRGATEVILNGMAEVFRDPSMEWPVDSDPFAYLFLLGYHRFFTYPEPLLDEDEDDIFIDGSDILDYWRLDYTKKRWDASVDFEGPPSSLWDTVKMNGDKHPKVTSGSLDGIVSYFNGLEFTRSVDYIDVSNSVEDRTRDTWYESARESGLLIRYSKDAKILKWNGNIEIHEEYEKDDDGNYTYTRSLIDNRTKSFVNPEDVFSHSTFYERNWMIWAKSARSPSEGERSCSGITFTDTSQYDLGNKETTGYMEVSTPAYTPKCAEVTRIAVVFNIFFVYHDSIRTTNTIYPKYNGESHNVDIFKTVVVEDLTRRSDYGYSGKIPLSVLADMADREKQNPTCLPDGAWITGISVRPVPLRAEVSFKLVIPT